MVPGAGSGPNVCPLVWLAGGSRVEFKRVRISATSQHITSKCLHGSKPAGPRAMRDVVNSIDEGFAGLATECLSKLAR
jgi:hypothetical protein